MPDLLYQPLFTTLDQLRRRELSPVELMQATLARIDTANAKLNAFVALRDRDVLLDEARAAQARILRGEARPLEGVPLGVKDLEDVEGMVTTHGSLPFREHVAARDSIQVERLEAAGAIVVGKTNAPEFGHTAITKNLVFGTTRNPWDPERTPGGSSGGSSAAIAGGLVSLATASDGGGSVRLPAAFTGCFGLKPSLGRIPHGPDDFWVTVDTATHGPLTRTVLDAAIHLDAVCGPHPLDPQSLPHPGHSYVEKLREDLPPLRIGFSPDLGHAVVQSDVAEVVARAARAFEERGHDVDLVEGGPPVIGRWTLCHCRPPLGGLASARSDRRQPAPRLLPKSIAGSPSGPRGLSKSIGARSTVGWGGCSKHDVTSYPGRGSNGPTCTSAGAGMCGQACKQCRACH